MKGMSHNSAHETSVDLPGGMFVGQDDQVFTPSSSKRIIPAHSEGAGHAHQRRQHACTARS